VSCVCGDAKRKSICVNYSIQCRSETGWTGGGSGPKVLFHYSTPSPEGAKNLRMGACMYVPTREFESGLRHFNGSVGILDGVMAFLVGRLPGAWCRLQVGSELNNC